MCFEEPFLNLPQNDENEIKHIFWIGCENDKLFVGSADFMIMDVCTSYLRSTRSLELHAIAAGSAGSIVRCFLPPVGNSALGAHRIALPYLNGAAGAGVAASGRRGAAVTSRQ